MTGLRLTGSCERASPASKLTAHVEQMRFECVSSHDAQSRRLPRLATVSIFLRAGTWIVAISLLREVACDDSVLKLDEQTLAEVAGSNVVRDGPSARVRRVVSRVAAGAWPITVSVLRTPERK